MYHYKDGNSKEPMANANKINASNADLLAEMDRFEQEISAPDKMPLPAGVMAQLPLEPPPPPPEPPRMIIGASTFGNVKEALETRKDRRHLSPPPPPGRPLRRPAPEKPSLYRRNDDFGNGGGGGLLDYHMEDHDDEDDQLEEDHRFDEYRPDGPPHPVGHPPRPHQPMFVPHQIRHRNPTPSPPRHPVRPQHPPGPQAHLGPPGPPGGLAGAQFMQGAPRPPFMERPPRGEMIRGPPPLRPPGTYHVPPQIIDTPNRMSTFVPGPERPMAPFPPANVPSNEPPKPKEAPQVVVSSKPVLYKGKEKQKTEESSGPAAKKMKLKKKQKVPERNASSFSNAAQKTDSTPAKPPTVEKGASGTPVTSAGPAVLSEDLERRLKQAEMDFIHKQKQHEKEKKKKDKKVIRSAGGQVWEDNSLLEWDPDDFRMFCGDLGNEVNDEILARAFNKYSSFVRAKVIRDKRTNKTKGYGFVSFRDPMDFSRAMREMNGKYVGSRPVKLRKSTWKERNLESVKKKAKEKKKLGLR